jgi:uncharacterized protein (TIGR00251 family)
MLTIKETTEGLTFSVYVQPRASKCVIVGVHQQALKVRLTAPPVEGAANKQCLEILAKALALPKSCLAVTGGQTHRLKQVSITGKSGPMEETERRNLKSKLMSLAQSTSR